MHKVLFCMYTYKYIRIYLTSQSSGHSTFHQVGCTQTSEHIHVSSAILMEDALK